MAHDDDFYEEDEPVEEIRRRFREGEKGLTAGVVLMVSDMGSVVIRDVQLVQLNLGPYLRGPGRMT